MKKFLTILLIACCTLPAFAGKRQSEEIITPLTQLEKRQIQTRTYPSQDRLLVMKSVLNVLQDEGYIVYNVNSMLGFIYGVKDFEINDNNVDISKEFGLSKSRLNYNGVKVATLETTANVTDYGKNIRVRINFKRKLLNEYGNAQFIDDINEPEFYSDFYEKLDKAIELQKNIQSSTKKSVPAVRKPETVETKPQTAEPQTQVQESENNTETKVNTVTPVTESQTSSMQKVKMPENKLKAEPQTTESEQKAVEEKIPEKAKSQAKENKIQDIEFPPLQPKEIKKPAQNTMPITTEKSDKPAIQPSNEENTDVDNLLKQIQEQEKQAKQEAKQAKKEQILQQKQAAKDAKQAAIEQKKYDIENAKLQKEQLKLQKASEKEAQKAQKAAEKQAKKHSKDLED